MIRLVYLVPLALGLLVALAVLRWWLTRGSPDYVREEVNWW